jgi:hypothetical protein
VGNVLDTLRPTEPTIEQLDVPLVLPDRVLAAPVRAELLHVETESLIY